MVNDWLAIRDSNWRMIRTEMNIEYSVAKGVNAVLSYIVEMGGYHHAFYIPFLSSSQSINFLKIVKSSSASISLTERGNSFMSDVVTFYPVLWHRVICLLGCLLVA
jgi:hypothetical protein